MNRLSVTDRQRLEKLFDEVQERSKHLLGYPVQGSLDYQSLHHFLQFPINNVGDPFVPSSFQANTKELEREVLAWFAELTHAEPDSVWGYVTNGGTEGNLYGLYLARELLPNGMVYYSEATHYSVSKNLRLLRMPNIMLRTQDTGELDYDDLRETVRINRDAPPIIFANIGDTMREGVDDVGRIRQILEEFAIPRFYLHSDAALSGMTLPFIEDAPQWDFAVGIDSLSISGHKFIGSPVPCGIVLAKKASVDRIARSIEYIGTLDTTVTGSRNGITPLYLWYAIRTLGKEGFAQRVRDCLANAVYAVDELNRVGVKAWKNPCAITVVFPRPAQSVLLKWQLAVQGELAHIICMGHVTRDMIDGCVADIVAAEG